MSRVYTVTSSGIYLNALFYGEPGSGKTSLGASAQDHESMRNVLVMNVEGGLLSVAHRGDIQAVDITSTKEVEELLWSLVKSKSDGGEFEDINTIMLDNATELQAMNLQEIVAEAIANGRGEDQRDDIWQDDYGKSTNQLKRVFRTCRQLPLNFIVTAHAKQVFPKGANNRPIPNAEPIAILPSLTAKLSESLLGFVDFVWYLHFDDGTREEGEDVEPSYNLLTRTQGLYYAKTRGPLFRRALGQYRKLPEQGALAEIYDIFLNSATPTQATTRSTKKVKRAS